MQLCKDEFKLLSVLHYTFIYFFQTSQYILQSALVTNIPTKFFMRIPVEFLKLSECQLQHY